MKMNVRGIKPKLPQTACEKLMRIHFLPDLVSANRDLKSSYHLSVTVVMMVVVVMVGGKGGVAMQRVLL